MAHNTPIVRDDLLLASDEPIAVGSAGWFAWLERAERFRYLGAWGGFTARRERSSSGRGGDYWRAYRRQGGRLAHAYLGKPGALTAERLRAADARLGAPERLTTPAAPTLAPLLAAKLAPPPLRADRVPRPELVQRLASGLLPITLVAAPAGFGKTTLLAEWLADLPFTPYDLQADTASPIAHRTSNIVNPQAAWLALDQDDNDPARFWSYLVAALGRLFPNMPEQARAPQLLAATSGQTYLLNTIAAAPARGVLVLDDYHLIEAQPIHAGLAFLLEHLPAQLRVVLSTRAEPPLPLPRWRARGQLAELRADDLRFGPEQANKLLAAARPADEPLPAATLAALYARAEGWPAGLQLAALALRHAADPRALAASFGGSHSYLAEYLLAEVFERLPPATQRFLLHTAPLGRLCGPLCDAVRDEPSGCSGEMLAELERANLFLTRLDDAGEWYRFHHLFGEFLLARLRQTDPSAEPGLRRRAAEWLAQAGLPDEALGHAFACGDSAFATQLLAEHAPTLLRRGEFTTLRQRLAQLPEQLIWSQPRLALARIWDWLDVHQLGDVLPSLDRLDQLVAQPGPGAQLQAEALAVRAIVLAMRDQPEQALALAREVERMPLGHDLDGQAYVAFGLGAAHKMGLRFEPAAEQFRHAAALAQASGNTYIAFSSLGNLADVQYEQAQLYLAEQSSRRALAAVALAPGFEPPIAGWIHWSIGRIALQWGQLAQAREAAERCVALCAEWGNLGMHVRGYVLLAGIARATAEHDRAAGALAEAERLALQLGDPKLLGLVARQAALQALAERNLPLARRLCDQHTAGGAGPAGGMWATVQARVLMAEGQPAQALERLRPAWQQYAESELATLRVQLLVAEALARRACGQPEQAGAALERALRLAQPGGFVQIFLDEGAPMLELLRRCAAHSAAPHYLAVLLRAFGEPAAAPAAEPLTPRERQIVRALAAGLSNQAIAAELVIAESTLKRHLSNLYLKLGVHSRTQALARAAELHLLGM